MSVKINRSVLSISVNGIIVRVNADATEAQLPTLQKVVESYLTQYRHINISKDIPDLVADAINLMNQGWCACGAVAGVLNNGCKTSKLFVTGPDGTDHDIFKLKMNASGRNFEMEPFGLTSWQIRQSNYQGSFGIKKLSGDDRFGAGVHSLAMIAVKYDPRVTNSTSLGGISFVQVNNL